MHAAIRRSLWVASAGPTRLIAGRRYPSRRNPIAAFHFSPIASLDNFPWNSNSPPVAPDRTEGHEQEVESIEEFQSEESSTPTATPPSEVDAPSKRQKTFNIENVIQDRAYYGSAANRSLRNKRSRISRRINIPSYIIRSNSRRYPDDAPLTKGILRLSGNDVDYEVVSSEETGTTDPGDEDVRPPPRGGNDEPATQSAKVNLPEYSLNRAVMTEVVTLISAGFASPKSESAAHLEGQNHALLKSHLTLVCPIDGGIYFLDKVVEDAAQKLGADLISIDPQTLADLAGDHLKETSDPPSEAFWTLGYDTANVFHRPGPSAKEEEDEATLYSKQQEDEEDNDEMHPFLPRHPFTTKRNSFGPRVQSAAVIMPWQAPPRLRALLGRAFQDGRGMLFGDDRRARGKDFVQVDESANKQWNDFQLTAILEGLISMTSQKQHSVVATTQPAQPDTAEQPTREAKDDDDPATATNTPPLASAAGDSSVSQVASGANKALISPAVNKQQAKANTNPTPRYRIIVVKDFKEMRRSAPGIKLTDRLIDMVQKKRQEGQNIVLVGTTSTADCGRDREPLPNTVEQLQSDEFNSCFRTLLITPDSNRGLYHLEENRRIREINGKHIYSMIKRFEARNRSIGAGQDSSIFLAQIYDALKNTKHSTALEELVMSLDEVHRIVFTALGQKRLSEVNGSATRRIKVEHIVSALDLIVESDEVKTKWANNEQQLQNHQSATASAGNDMDAFDARIKKLRRNCNQHEKNLLRGVVNPQSISTAFTDVHAAPDTVEALKNLTTLSLTRPEAFKYGVLAKDKINGLLLYGPPGTGKTLLARAVAKESGATMLEVSGSDVYDMYVGEGEKNVRAVFSLAKRLAPCVVFIDEADAIFASRGSGTNRNSHRELINQFLREWDGLNETSAFIMVATNRPFDLDDAALRRLPRRLLVDLPSEKDREAILNIHLKGEDLASDVSLSKLASHTPLYSGSDLKNLAVAAALAAVREENEHAAEHEAKRKERETDESAEASEPHKFPEKRTLTSKHFEKAIEEISASVSEDMSSLSAIRKFDEKYGDRRGRKKKTPYGFFGGEMSFGEDTVKVRS